MLDKILSTYGNAYTLRMFGDLIIVSKYGKNGYVGGYTISDKCDCGSRAKWGHCKHHKMLERMYFKESWFPDEVKAELELLQSEGFPDSDKWKNPPDMEINLLTLRVAKPDLAWFTCFVETNKKIIEFSTK